MSLLRIDALEVRYGDRVAVTDFSLDVAPGEIVALVGESGSGKSTVALAAIGLLPRTARWTGSIRLVGQPLETLPPAALDRLRGGTAGMVFQEPMTALNPLMTIGRQIDEAARLHRADGDAARLLARVGLTVPPGRYPNELSGGQRQRVAIAIALAGDPQLIIADEPTTALDVVTQAHIVALLTGQAREAGRGLLLVSHDLGLVAGVADRIVVMKDGRRVEAGATRDVLATPQAAYTRQLVGRTRLPPLRGSRTRDAPPLLEVDGVTRRHGKASIPALDGVSLVVRPGESVGVVGESGSGKTTLLRTILGLERPDAGTVRLGGIPLEGARGKRLRGLRAQMQAVFQDPYGSLDPRQRIAQVVAEPLHLLDDPIDRAERRRRVEAALAQVGLSAADADRFPHEFSGGQRQRIAIARALIVAPALVLLDEAVSALDVSVRADILALLADLSDRLGLAYLFVSHDLGVMRAITDRLLVIKDGRIVEEGQTGQLLAAPRHPYTAALVAATPDLDRALSPR